ncbi:MAG: hypothetical protein HY719_11765, partial [Planctomycetes bacterium]|nr:hypothetical protein [Planctomycetota bacterium]
MRLATLRPVALVAACAGLLSCGCGPIPILIGVGWVETSDALKAAKAPPPLVLKGDAIVSVENPSVNQKGEVKVAFTVISPDSEPVEITPEFSLDKGATFQPATGKAGQSSTLVAASENPPKPENPQIPQMTQITRSEPAPGTLPSEPSVKSAQSADLLASPSPPLPIS